MSHSGGACVLDLECPLTGRKRRARCAHQHPASDLSAHIEQCRVYRDEMYTLRINIG